MTASLPSASRASFVASSEPSASPSGFSCVVTRKRSCARIASATGAQISRFVWGELIDQLASCGRRARPTDRIRRSSCGVRFSLSSLREPRLEDAVRRREPGERPVALRLVAEHADVDRACAQVGRRLDAGDRHEADPRVLEPADAPPRATSRTASLTRRIRSAIAACHAVLRRDDLALERTSSHSWPRR